MIVSGYNLKKNVYLSLKIYFVLANRQNRVVFHLGLHSLQKYFKQALFGLSLWNCNQHTVKPVKNGHSQNDQK